MEKRHLKNAPIKEAVIEIQFQPIATFSKHEIDSLFESFAESFNDKSYINQNTLKFTIDGKFSNEHSESFSGAFFKNEDSGYVLQILNERLSLSKTEPYQNFDALISKFFEIYQQCIQFYKDSRIVRIGIRYINEINTNFAIEKYIKNNNQFLSNNLHHKNKKSYHSYLLEMTPLIEIHLQSIIDIEEKKLILDIDCFSKQQLALNNYQEIELILQELRKYKNEVFFEIVSDDIESYL